MTRHELESRYPLIRPLSEEGARTYLARSGTGAIVMVHFIDAPPAAWRGGILGRLDSLDTDRRERIMEVHEVEGGGAVVTRFLMDFRSFPEWLGAGKELAAGADDAAADEFERLFGRAAAPPADALSRELPGAPRPGGVTPADSITDVFRAPVAPSGPSGAEMPPTLDEFPAVAEPS
ncbi:MAG TPA: hypothetical protein VFZ18_13045, partial [Longimicrobiaceae bacterium]